MTRYRYLLSYSRPLLGAAAVLVALLVMVPAAGALAQEDDGSDAPLITFLNPAPDDVISSTGDDDGDGPDILLLSLLTVGVAGGAGMITLIGYFVRRGVGYEPHRPGPDDEPHH